MEIIVNQEKARHLRQNLSVETSLGATQAFLDRQAESIEKLFLALHPDAEFTINRNQTGFNVRVFVGEGEERQDIAEHFEGLIGQELGVDNISLWD